MDADTRLKTKLLTASGISLLIIVVIIGGIVMYAQRARSDNRTQTKSQENPTTLAEETPEVVTGLLGLSLKGQKTRFAQGEQFTVFVYGDSKNQQMYGYDAVIRYNASELEYVDAESLIPEYDFIPTVENLSTNESTIVLSGFEKFTSGTNKTYTNTGLAEITFKVVKPIQSRLEVIYEGKSNKDSNLLSTTGQDIVNKVIGIDINAQ